MRFAPGGEDTSASANPTDGAPLLCGGTQPSRLAGAAIVTIPNTLSQISVRRYEFTSASAARGYFDALSAQIKAVHTTGCTVATSDSGAFSVVSLLPLTRSMLDASGTTVYTGGLYAGARQYNVIRYIQQDSDVYLLQVDRSNSYPDAHLVDALVNTINLQTSPTSSSSPAPAPLRTMQGLLERGRYRSLIAAAPGPWAQSDLTNCPQLIAYGTPYSISFVNQLPNVQTEGLVVLSSDGQTMTIPWGTSVIVTLEPGHRPTDLGCESEDYNKVAYVNDVSVTPVP